MERCGCGCPRPEASPYGVRPSPVTLPLPSKLARARSTGHPDALHPFGFSHSSLTSRGCCPVAPLDLIGTVGENGRMSDSVDCNLWSSTEHALEYLRR